MDEAIVPGSIHPRKNDPSHLYTVKVAILVRTDVPLVNGHSSPLAAEAAVRKAADQPLTIEHYGRPILRIREPGWDWARTTPKLERGAFCADGACFVEYAERLTYDGVLPPGYTRMKGLAVDWTDPFWGGETYGNVPSSLPIPAEAK